MQRRMLGFSFALIGALAIAGCSAPAPDAIPAPQASVVLHQGGATVETEDSVVVATDGMPLSPGDTVSTEGDDAMIDIAWSDGAVTRLGAETTFTVGDPASALGNRGTQAGGRSWNRVASERDGGDEYTIVVSGLGPTTNRGELFVVDCTAAACRIAGTGGSGGDGTLTSFRRTDVVTVVDSARLATWREIVSDAWAEQAAAIDAKSGLVPVEDLFASADPSRGVLEGTFDVVRTGRTRECSGPGCATMYLLQPGESRELVFAFHSDCADGACAASVDTQTLSFADGSIIDQTVPLVAGAEEYTWGLDDSRAICIWTYEDGTSVDVGVRENSIRWRVVPSKAEIVDGVFTVTELRGETHSQATVREPVSAEFPGCEQYQADWVGTSDLVLVKRGS